MRKKELLMEIADLQKMLLECHVDTFVIDTNNAIARLRNDINDLRRSAASDKQYEIVYDNGPRMLFSSYEVVDGFFWLFGPNGEEIGSVPVQAVHYIRAYTPED